ncbi:hypothetical protein BJ508DRAFT_365037 [Ascobolus immersus RN42]|uniref:Uncharacterized protein n=1 Tax=Ascobolus immersus RN42 TaxID=1160509 RepID=A0A3N4HWV8_ASCIM|nr:hypothetical protein BJ508DRAFT_365037 [Ascobolus immersus RN42]
MMDNGQTYPNAPPNTPVRPGQQQAATKSAMPPPNPATPSSASNTRANHKFEIKSSPSQFNGRKTNFVDSPPTPRGQAPESDNAFARIVNDAIKASTSALTNVPLPQVGQSVKQLDTLTGRQPEKRKAETSTANDNTPKKVHLATPNTISRNPPSAPRPPQTHGLGIHGLGPPSTPRLQQTYPQQPPATPHQFQHGFYPQMNPYQTPPHNPYTPRYEPYPPPPPTPTMRSQNALAYPHSPQGYHYQPYTSPQPYPVAQQSPPVPRPGSYPPNPYQQYPPYQQSYEQPPLLGPGKGFDNPAVHTFIETNTTHLNHLHTTVPPALEAAHEAALASQTTFEADQRAKFEAHRTAVVKTFSITPLAVQWRQNILPNHRKEVLERLERVIKELGEIDGEIMSLCGPGAEPAGEDVDGEWKVVEEEVREVGKKARGELRAVDKRLVKKEKEEKMVALTTMMGK